MTNGWCHTRPAVTFSAIKSTATVPWSVVSSNLTVGKKLSWFGWLTA